MSDTPPNWATSCMKVIDLFTEGTVADLERELFLYRVRRHPSILKAAASLGISTKTLYNRLHASGDYKRLKQERAAVLRATVINDKKPDGYMGIPAGQTVDETLAAINEIAATALLT